MAPAPAAAASPRLEPLLWIQLVGLGALPLEALLLLLLLAGNDPGPVPELERVFCWTLGALGPLLLFWRRPADPWSLLFVQTPLRGRRQLQHRLSALQECTALRIGLALGAAAELPLLWWLDRHAAVAAPLTPFGGTPRLVGLLVAALLLALMLWQWHQGLQALWLLSRNAAAIEAAAPLNLEQLEQRRLCLGLPLLLPDPLKAPPSAAVPAGPPGASEVAAASGGGAAAIAVEPEKPAEEEKRADLEDEVG